MTAERKSEKFHRKMRQGSSAFFQMQKLIAKYGSKIFHFQMCSISFIIKSSSHCFQLDFSAGLFAHLFILMLNFCPVPRSRLYPVM